MGELEGNDPDVKENDTEQEVNLDFGDEENTSVEEKEQAQEPAVKKETSMDDLIKEIDGYKEQIHNLNYALHKSRQSKKKDKDAEEVPEFSAAQFAQLLKEHAYKDDGELDFDSMVQIFNTMQMQNAKSVEKRVEEASSVRAMKDDMDAYLSDKFPEIYYENSHERSMINQQKEVLGITDHPYGDFFAMGALTLQNIDAVIATAKEEARQEFEAETKKQVPKKAEAQRKAQIKGNVSPAKGKIDKTGVSQRMQEVAKQMDLTPQQAKFYFKMMSKNKNIVSVD